MAFHAVPPLVRFPPNLPSLGLLAMPAFNPPPALRHPAAPSPHTARTTAGGAKLPTYRCKTR